VIESFGLAQYADIDPVINLNTFAALGVALPPTLPATADEVIE